MPVQSAGVAWSGFGIGVRLPTCQPSAEPFTHGELIKHADQRYELHYLVKMWMFEPSEVEVPRGSTVDLYLTSADVVHGFNLIGTSINLMAGTIRVTEDQDMSQQEKAAPSPTSRYLTNLSTSTREQHGLPDAWADQAGEGFLIPKRSSSSRPSC